MINNSLQVLDMRSNFGIIFGIEISSVASGLQCNKTLTELNVVECWLSAKGIATYVAMYLYMYVL